MDFSYGDIAIDVPLDFVPTEAWPEYAFIAAPPPFCAREFVGEAPRGVRWSIWPLTFEQYCSDLEPDLEASNRGQLTRNRLVMWRRIRRQDVPPGWRATKRTQVDGFRTVEGDFTANWHKNARRELRLWQERHDGRTHRIERIELPEFEAAYRNSLVSHHIGLERFYELRARTQVLEAAPHIELWGVRNIATGAIAAGTALIHSPTFNSSTHMAPFILAEGRGIYAAGALNAHWFAEAKRHGETYVTSTNFWIPGKPKSWQGFSEFKSHFGWRYIAYPPELTRFVRGKLF